MWRSRGVAPRISCVLESADRVDAVEHRLDLQGHADSWPGLCRAGLTHLLDLLANNPRPYRRATRTPQRPARPPGPAASRNPPSQHPCPG